MAPSQTRLSDGQRVRLDRDSSVASFPPTIDTQYHCSNCRVNSQSADEKNPSCHVINISDLRTPGYLVLKSYS